MVVADTLDTADAAEQYIGYFIYKGTLLTCRLARHLVEEQCHHKGTECCANYCKDQDLSVAQRQDGCYSSRSSKSSSSVLF
jgi:hypothetical protein